MATTSGFCVAATLLIALALVASLHIAARADDTQAENQPPPSMLDIPSNEVVQGDLIDLLAGEWWVDRSVISASAPDAEEISGPEHWFIMTKGAKKPNAGNNGDEQEEEVQDQVKLASGMIMRHDHQGKSLPQARIMITALDADHAEISITPNYDRHVSAEETSENELTPFLKVSLRSSLYSRSRHATGTYQLKESKGTYTLIVPSEESWILHLIDSDPVKGTTILAAKRGVSLKDTLALTSPWKQYGPAIALVLFMGISRVLKMKFGNNNAKPRRRAVTRKPAAGGSTAVPVTAEAAAVAVAPVTDTSTTTEIHENRKDL